MNLHIERYSASKKNSLIIIKFQPIFLELYNSNSFNRLVTFNFPCPKRVMSFCSYSLLMHLDTVSARNPMDAAISSSFIQMTWFVHVESLLIKNPAKRIKG